MSANLLKVRRHLVVLVAALGSLTPLAVQAQFTTIINVPPDVAPAEIGSDTQLNLFDGGSIGGNFRAGATGLPTVNIEVNISGGTVGSGFNANRGSTVNISAGTFENGFGFNANSGSTVNFSGGNLGNNVEAFNGSVTNISGGTVGPGFDAESGSTVNISGGSMGSSFEAYGGSLVNISGGSIGGQFDALSGSTVRISGGSFADDFDTLTGSSVRLIGNDFRLNGAPVNGLGTIGNTVPINLAIHGSSTFDVLTGVLADGFAFMFTLHDQDSIADGTLTLEAAVLPASIPGVFLASTNLPPLGLRAGQTLIVDAGASVPVNYKAAPGSIVEVQAGGTVDSGFEPIGATVNVAGGNIGIGMLAAAGATVNVSSGSVGDLADAFGGSVVNISGGTLGSQFDARGGSQVNVSGGLIGNLFEAWSGSYVKVSGGTIAPNFDALSGSAVRVIGNDFRLNGVPIEGLEEIGNIVSLDVGLGEALTAVFPDGRTVAFLTNEDSFAAGTLTLEAASIPAAPAGVFVASTDPLPLGLREGQTLIVDAGAALGDYYTASVGSTVELQAGGSIGRFFEAVGATVDISGGEVGVGMSAAAGTVVNMTDGYIALVFQARPGSIVNISGGSVQGFVVYDRSVVNLSGGTVRLGGNWDVLPGGVVNISGGTHIGFSVRPKGGTVNVLGGSFSDITGDGIGSRINISGGFVGDIDADAGNLVNLAGGSIADYAGSADSIANISGGSITSEFDAYSESVVNIFGREFSIGGVDITGALTEDTPHVVVERNVTLMGILADGTPFDFVLNTVNMSQADYFDSDAALSIILVSGIPGDYNEDGTVNAADYTVWRNNVGTTVAIRGKGGDGNFDGQVTQADYYVWKKHYGESEDGMGSGGEVPEPGAAMLLLVAVGMRMIRRGR